jgi:hypothetical protein
MFAKIQQVAAAGAAVAGVGWITVVSPGVAHAQPPRIPQGSNFICPDVAGINYLQDPGNSNAYYLCVDGLQQRHQQCPPGTKLIVATPPVCSSLGHHGM